MSIRDRIEALERTQHAHASRSSRVSDTELDAQAAAFENPEWSLAQTGPKSLMVLKLEHDFLESAGLLDPDEPTPYSDALYRLEMQAEFTPIERQLIRAYLAPAESP